MKMERERKKRKITDNEEEDEEVKMERFFALIRSAETSVISCLTLENQGRQQIKNHHNHQQQQHLQNQKKINQREKLKLQFDEPKDFAGNNQVSKPDLNLITKKVGIAGNSSRRSEEENDKGDHNNNSNHNKNHFQANMIVFDLNLFPVSVADLDTTDFSM